MDDLELKKVADLLNSLTESYKCFRHQFQPKDRRCRLCDAKAEAKGNFEYARLIFIKGW